MTVVTHVDVIKEESKFLVYIQTPEGFCTKEIDSSCFFHLFQILENKESFFHQILEDLSYLSCSLLKNGAILELINKKIRGTWEEAISIALIKKLPILVEKTLLQTDYTFDATHEQFVQELIQKEQTSDYFYNLEQLTREMSQAVFDERFEDASILRDKIQRLN